MSHVTIAASAKSFDQLFKAIVKNFSYDNSDSKNFGSFSASYHVKLHLEDGNLAMHDDNTIEVTELDIVWDILTANICFNLPGFCVGGFCIVPNPWNGCLAEAPKICIGGPICAGLDLSGLVTSEVSDLKASLVPKYYIDPQRPPNVSDLGAEFAGHPNKWQIYIDPSWVHVDPIDVADTVEAILEQAVKDAISNLMWWMPSWAIDLLWAVIGPILALIKSILEIAEEINEWISNLLGNMFDLVGLIETAVADYFASKYPIYEFEDPYPIMPGQAGPPPLIPVKIPIRNLSVMVNSKEMVVQANVGP